MEEIVSEFSESLINEDTQIFDDIEYNNADFAHELKVKYRFFRKRISAFIREKQHRAFTEILYVTIGEIPRDYILAFQKQYPDKEIKVVMPIIGENKPDFKPIMNFEFHLRNKKNKVEIYSYPKDSDNIQIYGIYLYEFEQASVEDLEDIKYLSLFLKSVRIFGKKIKPDIIHSDNIPFFMGAEFETKLEYPVKVFQTVGDFSKIKCYEPFWAVMNFAGRAGIRKMCSDGKIRNGISSVFRFPFGKKRAQINHCLEHVYKNYDIFCRFVGDISKLEDNISLINLNKRILKLFPQINCGKTLLYNPFYMTLKKANKWAVLSESYYRELSESFLYSTNMEKRIKDTIYKARSIQIGLNKDTNKILFPFDSENFREEKIKNKNYLVQEFSKKKIEEQLTDYELYQGEEIEVCGYLDSFYDSPLIFAKFSELLTLNGFDIAINSILKLFELNKNIQFIINVPNGSKNNYVKSFVEFCENHNSIDGRWLFIDGNINIDRFLAASDMILLPDRGNPSSDIHLRAMKYGCVPIVSNCGIYRDTVSEIFDSMITGCGFLTDENLNSCHNPEETYTQTVFRALNFYNKQNQSWNILIKNCLNHDSSWNFDIIQKYNEIYEELV